MQNGKNGHIPSNEIQAALKLLGIDLPGYQVHFMNTIIFLTFLAPRTT